MSLTVPAESDDLVSPTSWSLANQDLPDIAWSDDANIFDNAATILLTPLLRHHPSDEYIDSSLELGV